MKDIVNRNIWFLDILANGDEREKKIREHQKEIQEIKEELEIKIKELAKYKEENEAIKNSKWWKLRNKIKGVK